MRLFQLVTQNQLRGAEVFAFQLSREFERLGHETSIAYLYAGSGAGVLELRAGDHELGGRVDSLFERTLGFNPRLVRRAARWVDDGRPDVLQVNGSRSVKYGSILRRLRPQAPWILCYRNIGNPDDWTPGPLKRRLFASLVMSQMDTVVSVSPATLERVRHWYGMDVPSVCIPRGIDLAGLEARSTRDEVRARMGTPSDSPVFIFVGSLTPEKRLDRLLRVFRELSRNQPDAELWIAGAGPLEGEVVALAAELELGAKCRILGLSSDVATIINAADVLLLTSDTEGTPGVVLEAAALRVPSVATRVGGLEDCIVDGETGFLVDALDEAAFVDRCRRLIANSKLRSELGLAAKRHVIKQFALEDVASRYLDHYSRMLSDLRGAA